MPDQSYAPDHSYASHRSSASDELEVADHPNGSPPIPRTTWVLPTALLVIGSIGYGLVLLAVTTGPPSVDATLLAAVRSVPGEPTETVALAATWLGTYRTVLALSAVAAIALALWTRRLIEPLVVLAVGPITVRVAEALKQLTDRERPPTAAEFLDQEMDASFPSSHTANGTVLLLLVALIVYGRLHAVAWRRAMIIAVVVLVLLIGASRVYLGYHWPTDVLGGWTLALAIVGAALLAVAATRRVLAAGRDRRPPAAA